MTYRQCRHALDDSSVTDVADHLSICSHILKGLIVCNFNRETCSEKFNHLSSLVLHYYTQHGLYLCGSCGEHFKNKAMLDEHIHASDQPLDVFEGKKSVY